jgi:hypothetical protein
MVVAFGLIVFGLLLAEAGRSGRSIADILNNVSGVGLLKESKPNIPNISLTPLSDAISGGLNSVGTGVANAAGGAKGIVDQGAKIGEKYGLKVISSIRPGATTTTGSVSDHSENNENRAARDISNAVNALTGPPTPEMDAAVEEIAKAFGQHVNGKQRIVLTWHWNGFRLQLIYRTPEYGGHMGHIHFGARKL